MIFIEIWTPLVTMKKYTIRWKQMLGKLVFSEICCRGDRKGVMEEVKTLNKKIQEFCISKNLALIRHSDVNQNCLEEKKLHLHEKGISTLAISFKSFLSSEWQQNSHLGVGSDKVTADHNLTNQRQNISQNMSENFDSDLKKWKVLRVENDSNPIFAYLNINPLGKKITFLKYGKSLLLTFFLLTKQK